MVFWWFNSDILTLPKISLDPAIDRELEKYFPLKIGNFQGQCEFGGESAPKPNPIEIRKEHTWGKGGKYGEKTCLCFLCWMCQLKLFHIRFYRFESIWEKPQENSDVKLGILETSILHPQTLVVYQAPAAWHQGFTALCNVGRWLVARFGIVAIFSQIILNPCIVFRVSLLWQEILGAHYKKTACNCWEASFFFQKQLPNSNAKPFPKEPIPY
jgi:hypothetical protein